MTFKFPQTFISLLFLSSSSLAQTYNPRIVCSLPSFINESSGIEVINSNRIWTHNDGGAVPELYLIDSSGVLLRTLHILNSLNNDWEDLCRDDIGNIYIGDFGNNFNQRQDLKILKIPNPDTFTSDSITAQKIFFSYPDQSQFPPPQSQQNFDCEAMFHYGDSLYLFSKNRGNSTYTKMYVLPDDSGTYVATLLDSFNTSLWITAADINPSKNRIALLSESRIHVFENFSGNSFLKGNYHPINLTLTQKEGLSFYDDDNLFLSDEVFFTLGGNIYDFNLSSILTNIDQATDDSSKFTVYPNPADQQLKISCVSLQSSFVQGKIYNTAGQLIHEFQFQNTAPDTVYTVELHAFPAGSYNLHLKERQNEYNFNFLKQ